MAGWTWKMVVLVMVMVIFAILEYRMVEAQVSSCSQCASHADCYSASGGTYCVCRRGYRGDGYSGSGYSGCRRHKHRIWRVVVSIIGASLVLFCSCACACYASSAA